MKTMRNDVVRLRLMRGNVLQSGPLELGSWRQIRRNPRTNIRPLKR